MSSIWNAFYILKKLSNKKLEIRKDSLQTLKDFQKLLGDIQCLWSYFKVSTGDLEPLSNIPKGDSDSNSPRQLTEETNYTFDKNQYRSQKKINVNGISPHILTVYVALLVFTSYLNSGSLWSGNKTLQAVSTYRRISIMYTFTSLWFKYTLHNFACCQWWFWSLKDCLSSNFRTSMIYNLPIVKRSGFTYL